MAGLAEDLPFKRGSPDLILISTLVLCSHHWNADLVEDLMLSDLNNFQATSGEVPIHFQIFHAMEWARCSGATTISSARPWMKRSLV